MAISITAWSSGGGTTTAATSSNAVSTGATLIAVVTGFKQTTQPANKCTVTDDSGGSAWEEVQDQNTDPGANRRQRTTVYKKNFPSGHAGIIVTGGSSDSVETTITVSEVTGHDHTNIGANASVGLNSAGDPSWSLTSPASTSAVFLWAAGQGGNVFSAITGATDLFDSTIVANGANRRNLTAWDTPTPASSWTSTSSNTITTYGAIEIPVAGSGSVTSGAGAASGTGSASAVGAQIDAATGAASGAGTASAVGAQIDAATGAAAGTGTAAATGAAMVFSSGAGAATGTGTATGYARGFFAASSGTASTADVAPTYPAGIIANDFMIVIAECDALQSFPTTIDSAGWTRETEVGNGVSAGPKLTMWWKFASGGESGTLTVGDSGDHNNAAILVFRGVPVAASPILTKATDTTQTGTSPSWPSVTTVSDNAIILQVMADGADAGGTRLSSPSNANLAGISEVVDFGSTGGNGGGLSAIYGVKATAGSVGNTTGTNANSSGMALATWVLSAVSSGITAATGAAAGTGTADAAATQTAAAVGAASGVGTAAAVGSTAGSIGAAAGTGTASGVGAKISDATGAATGTGTAAATGAQIAAAVGSASGTGTAEGNSFRVFWVGTGTTAAGTGDIIPGFPSGIRLNDLMILSAESSGTEGYGTGNTDDAGWTRFVDTNHGGAHLTQWWKRALGTEGGSTINIGDSGDHGIAAISVFRGVDPSLVDPILKLNVDISQSGTSPDWASLVTDDDQSLVICSIANSPDTSNLQMSNQSASGMTVFGETFDLATTSGNGGTLGQFYGQKPTAGAAGIPRADLFSTGDFTLSTFILSPGSLGVNSGVGAATGTGTAAAIGRSINLVVGAASGTGTAAATGAQIASAAGAAAGTGVASGAASAAGVASGVGAASGTGTATGAGASRNAVAGAAVGTGTALATGAKIAASSGAAAGTGSAAATGRIVIGSDGAASGLGTASAVGRQTAAAIAIAEGFGIALAESGIISASIGQAVGYGIALADSDAPVIMPPRNRTIIAGGESRIVFSTGRTRRIIASRIIGA